ncbi:NUDIX domain-containing protein [Microbacterium sp. SLBN-146]|uniref:NUDIX hydrolase n=1 Tax=Microbacterium sp. SLBN-146 TaxID=2768457 RepID=UPI001151EAB8|nr:NUDIX domain-containing protein [Microbacterium sp. SLBN-146]TQJ32656.1 8-oxo-dGTP pyrophosphatase MutT (NUDIX family) [Microbacterium sp. SLBN-146]
MTEPSSLSPDTTAARATRVLTDIVSDSRPRVADDATDPAIPVAATLVLLRDTGAGIEVLMIERPDRGSFAGAWVFPGGKLEDTDRHEVEAEEDAARRGAVRETLEETGLVVDTDTLVTVSVWDPPPGIAVRIRTWFFVAAAPTEGSIRLQAEEAVRAEWIDPAEAIARHSRGDLMLYPPTWVTLHELADAASVSSLVDATRLSGVRRFDSIARRAESGPMLLWSEDAEYEAPGADGASRHRLEIGALPWIYTRSD